MELIQEVNLLKGAVEQLMAGFTDLPKYQAESEDEERIAAVLKETALRMQDNQPFFHPMYAGQMIKPPHPIARLAYAMAMWINPNNHALEGGRASAHMEKEAVAKLAQMFGFSSYLGHLTGGGTLANMEALWIAGKLHPGRAIVASQNAHYTHKRMCEVLGIPFIAIPCDKNWHIDIDALEEILRSQSVGTVVVTMGTTMTGSVDPLPEIINLSKKYNFRIHADAAYGGYYSLLGDDLELEVIEGFEQLKNIDSIVIDPHKHGLQAYGCGCILFRDSKVGTFYKHDSPYTYFNSDELHLGEISLECSRPGAAAVALWATLKLFPLDKDGQMAKNLAKCRQAILSLYSKIKDDKRFLVLHKPDLDILVWALRAPTASQSSRLAEEIFDQAAAEGLHLTRAKIPVETVARVAKEANIDFVADTQQVTCLRSALLKPEHLNWLEQIWSTLNNATAKILEKSLIASDSAQEFNHLASLEIIAS